MKGLATLFLAASAGLAAAPKVSAQDLLDRAVATIRAEWSYLVLREQRDGLNLDRVAAEARARWSRGGAQGEDAPQNLAPGERSAEECALRHLISALGDGHAAVHWPRPLPTHGEGVAGAWPVRMLDLAEGVVVAGVHPSLPASLVAPGDRVLAVDGQPVEAWLAEGETQVFASTPLRRRRLALWDLLQQPRSTPVTLAMRRYGARRAEKVELPLVPVGTSIGGWMRPRPRAAARWLEDRIAYFCPESFSPPAGANFAASSPEERERIVAARKEEWRTQVQSLADSKVLLIDLRANPGGTDLLGKFLASMLLPAGTPYFQLSARRDDDTWTPFHAFRLSSDQERLHHGTVICLIDERTFSTADNFAVCLRDTHPDVRFVGRPNGAGTGAPRGFDLGDGVRISFCTQRVLGPAGGWIEGHPIQPDRRVRWSVEDFLAHRDPDLETALDLARSMVTQ